MTITFHQNGQWDLKKSDDLDADLRAMLTPGHEDIKGGILSPKVEHMGKPNYDKFQALHEQFGTGHFSYNPKTYEISAHSDTAIGHLNNLRSKPKSSETTFNEVRENRIKQNVSQWTNRLPKP